MKLFTATDIREIDRQTIENEGIESIALMERAAAAITSEICARWSPSQRIFIFAGPGNNGGDALAVARLLIDQEYQPEIMLFNTRNKLSEDCSVNRRRLLDMEYPYFQEVVKNMELPELGEHDVVIDGLFGSGLDRPLSGGYQALVRFINESGAFVLSIDVPSGLFGEINRGNIVRNIVHADLTLTFQFPRLSFFFAEYAECVGCWKTLDLHLDRDAIRSIPSSYFLIDGEGVKEALRPRNPFSTKDAFGRIFLVAGSLGMMGAAVLSARAAMRAGAGVVTLHSPKCGYLIAQTAVPEALFEMDADDSHITDFAPNPKTHAVAIGCGIGTEQRTVDALSAFLKKNKKPVVLDADALNCIVKRPELLSDLPVNSIITPHAKEFDRLFGEHFTEEERYLKAVEMARYFKICIVLKAHHTMVVRPDGKTFVNSTGNAGMATAGSGDVLTGIIAAFLGQGYRPDVAANVGVYIHGAAGDMAAQRTGEYGLVASDIVDSIGPAIKSVIGK